MTVRKQSIVFYKCHRGCNYIVTNKSSFKKHLDELKLIDTYRYMNPTKVEYSYWSYRFNYRKKNNGWRIDYFLVSDSMKNNIKKAKILTDVLGSDHAPIQLSIKI